MMHTTNYTDTVILPSQDCKALGSVAPTKPDSIAGLQFAALDAAPYAMTSDDLLVHVTALRRGVPEDEYNALQAEIFSKGQACMRASPLVKTLGWAVHHDAQCRVALVAVGSPEYARLVADASVTKVRGMRNKRA